MLIIVDEKIAFHKAAILGGKNILNILYYICIYTSGVIV